MTADTRRPTARPSSTESILNPPTGALSASRLSLAARCPGAFALPHAEHDSPQAATGTAIHAYVAAVLDGEHEPLAEVEDAKAREVCSRLSTSALVETVGGHEALVGGRILTERAVALTRGPDGPYGWTRKNTGTTRPPPKGRSPVRRTW